MEARRECRDKRRAILRKSKSAGSPSL
jgi:hypothetical protein